MVLDYWLLLNGCKTSLTKGGKSMMMTFCGIFSDQRCRIVV
jgi:hypothetical protein